MSLPHFSLPKCHIYRAYQIVTTTFVFTKLCLSFLCLPNCCYQNDASCTYLLVITKFVITLSPFHQIVSYQICHYQNCPYQVSITKNPPIKPVMWILILDRPCVKIGSGSGSDQKLRKCQI